MGDIDGGHLVTKVRLKHILSSQQHVERLNDAVKTIHEIGTNGLVFGKLLYLEALDEALDGNKGEFDAKVAKHLADSFPMDADQVEEWLDTVSSSAEKRQGRPYGEDRKQRQERLHAAYDDYAFRGLLPANKLRSTNLSIPKGFLAQQLAVNYATNVHCHYDKYVRRFVTVSLTQMAREEAGLTDKKTPLPRAASQRLKTDIRAVCNDILQASPQLSCREVFHIWVELIRPEVMPPAPTGGAYSPHWRFISQKQHPEQWLPYMVWINQKLEVADAKLYSPLLQRTSFMSSHMRIDTTGLIDLLIDGHDDASLLKASLEKMDMPLSPTGPSSATTKYNLPGLDTKPAKKGTSKVSKALFYNSLSKILDPKLLPLLNADPTFQTASFKSAIWRCMTKLGSNKHTGIEYKGLIFNNVIDTDGHSVSLHYVARSLFGKTTYNGGFKEIKASQRQQQANDKAKGATYVTDLSAEEREAILKGEQGTILGGDPGKGNLLTVTDGKKVVKYSYAQRRSESGAKEHAMDHRRRLDVKLDEHPGAKTAGELLQTIGAVPGQPNVRRSAKSCLLLHYSQYLRTRNAIANKLYAFYRLTVFRADRFDAWVGRRASEDRFASQIKNTFGKEAVIMYGNWGRSPNLKHQPPSPGIGLRRKLCSYFKVYLVHEAYTSSVCPTCDHGVTKPRMDAKGKEVHHLLKCVSHTCFCPWWNRDVLGALNILRTGKHALRTGTWHPTFAHAPAAA
jgi:hypothetical protein